MRLLADTHVFLWYVAGDPALPPAFRAAIQSTANEVYLSVASVWEAVIKHGLGKLALPAPPDEYLPRQRVAHNIASLAIDEAVMAHVARLPPLHRDPFDRMLVAQALQHGLTILTADDAVKAYPASCLSA
ncbi:MAG: PilT protein domain protein [Phycisphaerales bacterium]|nr:PilT protein domain protein [Phycisphaerales bacterium]